jgi:DNA polymerase III subunit gamma/tau
MGTVSLNLSRKWRSQNFDQIVGQDLVVRILKNSLYLGHYFPVYLLAGQRGCGKTSTARVFAAAVNCAALVDFQKDPKKAVIPCLVCPSCSAMRDGNHPDFIEIDAASHTGVDNIRNIIESSSLLPLMGRKRVYLIDEAHMLSKAAFNAALKILEEPPATALFILATTNQHKIIDTVRSRCFQLFFTPIAYDPLKLHVQQICKKEKIAYDDQALDLIVRHTEGSARDALNLLEQVRFASSTVSKEAVLSLLGQVSDHEVVGIIHATLRGAAADLLRLLQNLSIDQYKAECLWERLMLLLRALIWLKHGVNPHTIIASVEMAENVAKECSLVDLYRMVEFLYSYEDMFLKTTQQHIFLEMILLSFCQKNKKKPDDGGSSVPSVAATVSLSEKDQLEAEDDDTDDDEEEDDDQNGAVDFDEKWSLFVQKMGTLEDQLVGSLFKQARFLMYDQQSFKIVIELSKDFILFKDWLEDTQKMWQPVLRELFSSNATIEAQFTGINKIDRNSNKKISEDVVHQPVPKHPARVASSPLVHHKEKTFPASKVVFAHQRNEPIIDVSDESVWKIAPLLLRHFPGVITEIREIR